LDEELNPNRGRPGVFQKHAWFTTLGASVCCLAVLGGCDSATQPSAGTTITNITVSPITATVGVGNTLQLTAVIDPSASSAKKLTWATSSPSVALVSETGLVTALAGGLATITATSASDKTRFGSSTMTFVTVDAKKLELKLALTADVILLQATGVGTSVGMVPLSVSSSYSDAIGAAQIVHGNPSATYNQVDSAITALGTATATFTEAKVTPLGASKTSLLVALAAATTLKNSTSGGSSVGQVDPAAMTPFANAIAVATAASTDSAATAAQYNSARTTLETAIATFKNAIVVADNLYLYVDVPSALSGTSAVVNGLTNPSPFAGGSLTARAVAADAVEGNNSLTLNLSGDGQGFSFVSAENDLTRYSNLRFSLKTNSTDPNFRVKVSLKMVGLEVPVNLYSLSLVADGAYHEVVIPLSRFTGLNLAVVNVPFQIMASGGSANFSAQLDKVYFSKN